MLCVRTALKGNSKQYWLWEIWFTCISFNYMYLQKVIKFSLFILLLGINITFILINQIRSEKERDRNMTARSITSHLTTPIDIICNTSD